MVYRFLVESTKIENATFSYKTALSQGNVKVNRLGSTKWTYHKERGFAGTILFFWRYCFRLGTSYEELVWNTQMSIFILFVSAGVLFVGTFPFSFIMLVFWVKSHKLGATSRWLHAREWAAISISWISWSKFVVFLVSD